MYENFLIQFVLQRFPKKLNKPSEFAKLDRLTDKCSFKVKTDFHF